jgi:hypothetical protein
MKVLVCGSRKWVDPGPIRRELLKLPSGTIVVHGAAQGADNIAGAEAKKLRFIVRPYPADWIRHKNGAGPIRNREMLKCEHPDPEGVYLDLVLAFHEDPGLGKGTKDMVAIATAANPVIRIEKFQR